MTILLVLIIETELFFLLKFTFSPINFSNSDIVNISWTNEYPWEIAAGKPENNELDVGSQELPMVLDVNFGFTPIHSFIPTAGGNESNNQSIASKYITNGFTDESTYIKQK